MDEDRDHDAWVAALVQHLTDGTPLDLAEGEDLDLIQAAGWPDSRRVPGEALRAALLNPDVRPDPRGLKIRAAYITGITDLADLRLSFGLHFDSCAFEQLADWSRLTVARLSLIDCAIPGLNLKEAYIGELELQGATLTNEGDVALGLDGAEVKGDAFLNSLTVTGRVAAAAATIGGQLRLEEATLTNEGGVALGLDFAEVKGGAFLKAVTVTGMVRAIGATFGGQLILEKAILTNEGDIALGLDGADIKVGAFLNPVTVIGELTAAGATIGGQLSMAGATLTNEGGIALALNDADIKGGAFLNPVTVTGEVRAYGATIGGALALRDASLTNDGGIALALDRADIKGSTFLDRVILAGELQAPGATIGGRLVLQGASLTNDSGNVLNLKSARLTEVLLTPAAVKGDIALEAAQITLLSTPDDKNDMKVLIGNNLSASGWRLGDVQGRIRHDRKAAADWLTRDNVAEEFVAQPWHELADVYERNGQPADARWMRSKAAQGVTRTSPWWSKPIRWIYGALAGHGYYPLIAALWLILAIVASGVIVAANAAVFTPTAANKAAWKTPPPPGQTPPPITGATPCEDLQDRSSCLKPGLYAFDNTLPGTLATGQAAQWTANGAQGLNTWIPYTLGGLKIASWILVALLLAGVTGLLRKT